MTRKAITNVQAGKLYAALRPTLVFLTVLEYRLAKLGFTPSDDFFGKVRAANDAYRELTAEALRRSCVREASVARTTGPFVDAGGAGEKAVASGASQ